MAGGKIISLVAAAMRGGWQPEAYVEPSQQDSPQAPQQQPQPAWPAPVIRMTQGAVANAPAAVSAAPEPTAGGVD